MKNKMYMWAFAASLISSLAGSGLGLFLPKTLEHQFGYPAWQATLFIGLVFALGGSAGSFINGCLIKKLKMKPPAMAIHILVTKIAIIAVVSCMIFVTCPPAPIDSVDVTAVSNMTTSCNAACSCGQEAYAPVCGADGTSYFSPCHAGCPARTDKEDGTYFSDCACVNSTLSEERNFDATLGFCERPFCANSAFYIALLCLWAVVGNSNDISGTLFKFRAIKDDQKAIASGFSQISASVLRGVFSALVVGRLIDATCAIWKLQCGEQKHCFMYDMKSYHFLVHILCVIFTLPSALFVLGAYLEARKKSWDHLDEERDSEEQNNQEETKMFVNNNNNNVDNNDKNIRL